jgi:hypothetical protein
MRRGSPPNRASATVIVVRVPTPGRAVSVAPRAIDLAAWTNIDRRRQRGEKLVATIALLRHNWLSAVAILGR